MSGTKFSATYGIDFESLKANERDSPLPANYGPTFAWRADGTISRKGFYYVDGLQELNMLDTQGYTWWRTFSDFPRNEAIWILYERDGEVIGYSRGQDDLDLGYHGQPLCVIEGVVLSGTARDNQESFRYYLRSVRDAKLKETNRTRPRNKGK